MTVKWLEARNQPWFALRRMPRAALLPLLLLLAAVTLSRPARADNAADEADVAFTLGNKAYARRDYAAALSSYFLSYRLVPNRNVLFNIARCYEALRRFNEAYRYYNDLATLALPARDRREVAAALARIRPRVALVRIQTEPPDAEIFVGREDLGSRGRAPQTLALPPGRHMVLVRREGYRPAKAALVLRRGREVSHTFRLKLITGEVALSGSPEGAWVRESADGPTLGTVPGKFSLPPGKRLLHVGAPGYATSQLLVEVAPDKVTEARVELSVPALPTGTVVLTSNRENALVRVDGKEAGFTPTVLSLPEGEHTVEVSTPEVYPLERRVQVVRDQESRLHADLHYQPPPVKAASKSLLALDEAPASTTVITAEEIRSFGYTTLSEALAAVRGTFLSNNRRYTYAGIRGFAPPGDLNTRILVLYDGHAMNDVWAGQGYIARDLGVDLEEVERIEIVRGPGSALYGTGAFFAVINIVPRDTLRAARNVEVTGAAGSLGAWRGHLTGSLRGSEWSATFSAAGRWAAGADTTDLSSSGNGLVRGLDGERSYNGSARVRWRGLTVTAYLNQRWKDIPTAPFGTVPGAPGTRQSDARGFVEALYEGKLAAGTYAARAYYDASRYDGSWVYPDEGGGTRLAGDSGQADWLGAEGQVRLPLFARNHLTAGLEAQHQLRVDQAAFGFSSEGAAPLETRRRSLFSAYLNDEWALHPRASLSAGLRVDKYLDLENVPVTPRVAVTARPYDGGLTKLVVGSAFRAPNVYELYYEDAGSTQKPALRLDPETIATFELEHSHDLTPELRLTVAGYHNRITRLIALADEQAATPECGEPRGTLQCVVFQNTPTLVRAFGAEAELRWQPGRFALVDLSYSFVNLLSPEPELRAGVPSHLLAARLLLPLGASGLRLAAQATYQGPRASEDGGPEVGEALLVNFGLSGELSRLRFFAGVNNLLDTRYQLSATSEAPGLNVPQYGRTFLLQLTASY